MAAVALLCPHSLLPLSYFVIACHLRGSQPKTPAASGIFARSLTDFFITSDQLWTFIQNPPKDDHFACLAKTDLAGLTGPRFKSPDLSVNKPSCSSGISITPMVFSDLTHKQFPTWWLLWRNASLRWPPTILLFAPSYTRTRKRAPTTQTWKQTPPWSTGQGRLILINRRALTHRIPHGIRLLLTLEALSLNQIETRFLPLISPIPVFCPVCHTPWTPKISFWGGGTLLDNNSCEISSHMPWSVQNAVPISESLSPAWKLCCQNSQHQLESIHNILANTRPVALRAHFLETIDSVLKERRLICFRVWTAFLRP